MRASHQLDDGWSTLPYPSCSYVTIEPCIMCASALSRIGVRRAVFGPGNDKFGGCGSILSIHLGLHTPGGAHARPSLDSGSPAAVALAKDQSTASVQEDPEADTVIAAALAHFEKAAVAKGGSKRDEPAQHASTGTLGPQHACQCCAVPSASGDAAASASSYHLHTGTHTGASECGYRSYAVTRGVRSSEAIALLQRFYSRGNERAPQPRVRQAGGSAGKGGAAAVPADRESSSGLDSHAAVPATGDHGHGKSADLGTDKRVASASAGLIEEVGEMECAWPFKFPSRSHALPSLRSSSRFVLYRPVPVYIHSGTTAVQTITVTCQYAARMQPR